MKILKIITLCTLLGLIACDAPRNNPLDPDSATYSRQSEVLQIRRLSSPLTPLSGITVIAPELGLSAVSDHAGEVVFSHGRVNNYTIYTSHEQFFPMQVLINGGGMNAPILLNARPMIMDREIHSVYNNTNGSTEFFTGATISDPDGLTDIRAVTLTIPEYAYRDTFQIHDAVNGYFVSNQNITAIDASMTSGTLPELPFIITVYNQNGDSVTTDALHVTRVIDQDIFFTAPAPLSSLSGPIDFSWNAIQLDFPFTFELELYAIEDNNFKLVHNYTAIHQDSVHFKVREDAVLQQLTAVNNFARISILDNSGNRCYSIPLFFTYE
ncbi:MAG: hypothetical protein D6677_00825 [Calditrichaeota bacterium]|nr:MAG: hypothetical protein D6677_00825 [Calditrichota bacterium]